MRRNLRRALPIGRPMCVAPSLYALAQWWRDPMESVNKGDTVFVWGFPWHIHSRINLFWFNSRRKHNTKFQHNLKSQRQFCWIYSVFRFSNIHVRPLVSGPENGRLFIKNENWYIIGKRFSRSTHLSCYRRGILKRGQVDFFSHRCHGHQRPLTSSRCNNMYTSLEYAFLDLHVYTIKNKNT